MSRLVELESAARYSIGFVAKGDHPGRGAQDALDRAATEWIAEHGGMPRSHFGRYNRGDKFGDRPKWQDKPYRTAVMASSGAAGRRSLGQKVHGASPSTRV